MGIANRKYSTILRFEDHNYYEDSGEYNWTMFGGSDGVDFKEESVFKDTIELDRNCMHVMGPKSYMCNTEKMYVGNGEFSISCWFKLDPETVSAFMKDPSFFCPFLKWRGTNGKEIVINILAHDKNPNLIAQSIEVIYDGGKQVNGYGSYIDAGEWIHFLYSRKGILNRIWINGKKISDFNIEESANSNMEIDKMYIGNGGTRNDVWFYVDDFVVFNEAWDELNFEPPTIPFYWRYPDVGLSNKVTDIFDSKYIYGPSTGVRFKYYEPSSVSGNRLKFDSMVVSKAAMLFCNSTFVEPNDGWSPVGNNMIEIKSSVYANNIDRFRFTLVTLEKDADQSKYELEIKQTPGAENKTEFAIPDTFDKYRNKSDSAFMVFDGSLSLIQKDRYTIYHSGIGYMLKMNDSTDFVATNGMNLTFIFMKRKSYSSTPEDKDPDIENSELLFQKFTCPIVSKGCAELPKFETYSSYFGSIPFSIESMILFVNGTFMPPVSYTIENGLIKLIRGDDDNFGKHDEVEAIIIASTDGRDYDIENDLDTYDGYLAGSSKWEMLTHHRITRISYFKYPLDWEHKMYHKILWDANNKAPDSNFDYWNKIKNPPPIPIEFVLPEMIKGYIENIVSNTINIAMIEGMVFLQNIVPPPTPPTPPTPPPTIMPKYKMMELLPDKYKTMTTVPYTAEELNKILDDWERWSIAHYTGLYLDQMFYNCNKLTKFDDMLNGKIEMYAKKSKPDTWRFGSYKYNTMADIGYGIIPIANITASDGLKNITSSNPIIKTLCDIISNIKYSPDMEDTYYIYISNTNFFAMNIFIPNSNNKVYSLPILDTFTFIQRPNTKINDFTFYMTTSFKTSKVIIDIKKVYSEVNVNYPLSAFYTEYATDQELALMKLVESKYPEYFKIRDDIGLVLNIGLDGDEKFKKDLNKIDISGIYEISRLDINYSRDYKISSFIRRPITINGNNKVNFKNINSIFISFDRTILLNGLADHNNENYEFTFESNNANIDIHAKHALVFTNFRNSLIDYSRDPKPLIINGLKLILRIIMDNMIYVDWSNMNSYVDLSKLFKIGDTKMGLRLRNLNCFPPINSDFFTTYSIIAYGDNMHKRICILDTVKNNIPYEDFIIKLLDLTKLNTVDIDLSEYYGEISDFSPSYINLGLLSYYGYGFIENWKYRYIQVKKIRINAKYLESVDGMFHVVHCTDSRIKYPNMRTQLSFDPSKWVLEEVTFVNPNNNIKPKLTHEIMDYRTIGTIAYVHYSPPIIIGTRLPYTIKIEYT